jgi:hypothetical protein
MKIRGIPMSGRSGPVVYCHRRGTQYVRRHVLTKDLKTAAQRRVREIMEAVSKGFGGWLTQPERDAWELAAKEINSRPRLGQSGPLTGQELFEKLNFPRSLIGREWLRLPAARVVFGPSPVGELTIGREQGRLRLELAVVGPVTGDLMVLATPPCRPTWCKCRKPRYLGLLPAPVNGVSDITALYLERFGEPEPGQRIFIRTVQQRDGWESGPTDTSDLVPAQHLVAEVAIPRPGLPESEHRTLNIELPTSNRVVRDFRRSRFEVRSSRFNVRPPALYPPCPWEVHAVYTVVARWLPADCRPLRARIRRPGRPWGTFQPGGKVRNGPWPELWHHRGRHVWVFPREQQTVIIDSRTVV